jgi:hypothetical protein
MQLTPVFAAHLPAFQATFGTSGCIRVVPGAGDSIQMVPGPHGGVDVFLNLDHSTYIAPTSGTSIGSSPGQQGRLLSPAQLRAALYGTVRS